MSDPTILYIAGNGRSGSTLINQILGGVDGWFGTGELWLLWRDVHCACNSSAKACEFWGPVIESVRGRVSGSDPAALERELGAGPANLLAMARDRRRLAAGKPALLEYPELLSALYREIHAASGAKVIVDSSKRVTPALLAGLTGLELRVVHIVRDPRAFAHAWTKNQVNSPRGTRFPQWSPSRSSFQWLRRHIAIEALLRRRLGAHYMLLRYEDFVAQPQASLRSVCAFAGDPDAKLPLLDDRTVRLEPGHNIAGNRQRYEDGAVKITEDRAWKEEQPRRQALVASVIAAPLAPRYGYPLMT